MNNQLGRIFKSLVDGKDPPPATKVKTKEKSTDCATFCEAGASGKAWLMLRTFADNSLSLISLYSRLIIMSFPSVS
jgi:hypothetical protein